MNKNKLLKNSHRTRVSVASVTEPTATKRLASSRIYLALSLTLVGIAVVCDLTSELRNTSAQTVRTPLQQDLELVFARHEKVKLDPRSAADRVRQSGRMSLVTPSHDFELQLRQHDMRAPNYRAEEVGSDGHSHRVTMAGVSTYKGNVEGVWASDARFTISDNKIEGMIATSNESYYLEPAQKYSRAAEPTDYVFYAASDVRPDIVRTCADTLENRVAANAKELMSNAATNLQPAVFSPFKVVEIATEADYEYTNALGGSSAANNDILSIMNQVEAIYERDIGLTFTVVFQHTWNTPGDPYTANGDGPAMLTEFTNYWNANFGNTPRDVAHMWTGRSLGSSAGIAWMSVVCLNPTASYGVSDHETIAPFRIGIPAHEIGHNFNATHADGQTGCPNTIMVATQNQSNNLSFCSFSVNEITSFINNNSSCLTDAAAGNPIDQTDFFVRQHYLDFLGRTADTSGLDFWTRQITNCGNNAGCIEVMRINVSASFFLSIEFQQTGYLVERTYKTAYGDVDGVSLFQGTHTIKVPVVRFSEFLTDTSDIGNGVIVGQSGWEQTLENNKVSYFNLFVQTTRFTSRYPLTMLPTDYVHNLNVNAGSPLSPAEESQLAVQHTTGQRSRAQVLRQIAEHNNLAVAEFNRAFVLMQYYGYLRRNPNDAPDADYSGYDFWLTKLVQFNGNYIAAEMVKAFLSSTEYRRRFGTP